MGGVMKRRPAPIISSPETSGFGVRMRPPAELAQAKAQAAFELCPEDDHETADRLAAELIEANDRLDELDRGQAAELAAAAVAAEIPGVVGVLCDIDLAWGDLDLAVFADRWVVGVSVKSTANTGRDRASVEFVRRRLDECGVTHRVLPLTSVVTSGDKWQSELTADVRSRFCGPESSLAVPGRLLDAIDDHIRFDLASRGTASQYTQALTHNATLRRLVRAARAERLAREES